MFGKIRDRKRIIFIGAGIVIILLAGLRMSSRYLVYSDMPVRKSDIIVLFIGPDEKARQNEARQLIREGFSDFLFVSSYLRLYRAGGNGNILSAVPLPMTRTDGIELRPKFEYENNGLYFKRVRREFDIPFFYENTHVEILLTKKVMDAYGFKKAIFVSMPYHMRRIKIITEKVFGTEYDIKMAPSQFEKQNNVFSLLRCNLSYSFMEYPKIIWFISYEALV
ncbi:MAG TPA: hypothetical protein VMU29_11710 [Smithella sp.]|nr:hypothetical protein [Smithella sp.]